MTLQEFRNNNGCIGCPYDCIVDEDGRRDCTFPWYDDDAEDWNYGKNCDEISE